MYIWLLNHHAREEGRHPSLSKYLAELGSTVTLFSSSFLHNSFKETKKYRGNQYYIEENKENYRRVYVKTPSYHGNGIKRLVNQLSFAYRSYKVGKLKIKTESTPEVIIGSSVHLFTGVSAYFLAKKSNAKFVFEIRDIWPQTLVDLGAIKEKSLINKVFETIEKFLYKKADLIVSVLPDADKHIVKLGVSREKIEYIPNGIDVEVYNNSLKDKFVEKEAKEFFETNKGKFIVTFAGAHGVANGLNTVIEAAKKLEGLEKYNEQKTHILLIGDGPQKNKLMEQALKLNINNVSFLNKVKKNQIPHVLKKSDACLFHLASTPVFKYGISSNKLFDYMMSGKPMIFAVDTSYDFAKEANNGISIMPENPEEMAKSITILKEMSPKQRKEMGDSGINFVKENHDLKLLASRLINCLSE